MCANSKDSRESVRSLESALICADFYNSSKYFTLITCVEKSTEYLLNVYENINLSFSRIRKSSRYHVTQHSVLGAYAVPNFKTFAFT